MYLPLALVPLLLAPLGATAASGPARRSYDTHTYYTLELSPSASEADAERSAASLGAELVEPLGELAGHWIVRRDHTGISARSAVGGDSDDPVIARWHAMRSHARRALDTPAIRDVTRLERRQRLKRVPPKYQSRSRHSFRRWNEYRDDFLAEREGPDGPGGGKDLTELNFLQNEVGLHDPILNLQWHFANQLDPRWELNVTKLWASGVTGEGINVCVVDDGLDHEHPDLHDNYFAEGSYNYNDHDDDPRPRLSDDQHGTRCAGEIAAGANDACGVGVAYKAKVAGVRILSGPITDADEAAALNYKYQANDIYSCSWGPPDDGKSMEAPNSLILKSIVNGVNRGRDGKGSIFVFAAGNGGGKGDQCNFDGYTNSIFSVTVGAYDHLGNHPFYSEMCSALMVVAPSSGAGEHIHTTDVNNMCSHTHGGTSAAAPLAAGVFALALQVRPELTWRDVQHIVIQEAVMLNPKDEDWEDTATGRKFSYKFGYGMLDAGRVVEAARTWKLVTPQSWFDSPVIKLPTINAPERPTVPATEDGAASENGKRQSEVTSTVEEVDPSLIPPPHLGSHITEDGVYSKFVVTQDMLDAENFATLEHVTIRVWIDHTRRGDVEVAVRSPNNITSMLARMRPRDEDGGGFNGWKFMTLKHWGENPVGEWEIVVRDLGKADQSGRFNQWSMQLWGSSADPSKAIKWSPAEIGEVDEEMTGSEDFPLRPQKPKPTDHLPGDHGEAQPTGADAAEPTTAGNGELESEPTGAPTGESDSPAAAGADEGVLDGIDTLRKHSAWLGGAFLIVVLAALSGGGYFLYRQRKRAQALGLAGDNGNRGAYAPVPEEVPLGFLRRGARRLGLGGGRASAEETKELYDAFGDGPSDSEDDDDEAEAGLRYHDRFLDDEDEPHASGSGSTSHAFDEPPAYRDDSGDKGKGPSPLGPDSPTVGASNTSSGSWQDAADDVRS